MNATKYLMFLSFLWSFGLQAQYEWTPAKLIFKNGKTQGALVKFPKHSSSLIFTGSTEFKCKIRGNSKTFKFGHRAISEVVFGDEEFTTIHYKYVLIGNNKYVLMKSELQGKVNLYSLTVKKVNAQGSNFAFNGIPMNTSNTYNKLYFYVLREGEQKATLITPKGVGSFVSKAKKYFSDCKIIIEYLEVGMYELENIVALVEDYNLMCE